MGKIRSAYGVGGPTIPVFPVPVSALRAPINGQDVNYPQGQSWFNNSVSPAVEYIFAGAGVWTTGTPGSISSVSGTANQITAVTASDAVTLSIPSAFIAPGSIASTTTITSGTGITSTTGNIVATAGNITATAGNISATAGSVSAGTTVTAGTGISATTGNVVATAGEVIAGGDTGGVASTTALTNTNSTTISTGIGSVKMSSTNAGTNAAWIKIYVGTTAYWIPAWTTNSP